MADFAKWAAHALAIATGMSERDVAEAVLPSLLAQSDVELQDSLFNLLGDDFATMTEFMQRKAEAATAKEPKAPAQWTPPTAGVSYAAAHAQAEPARELTASEMARGLGDMRMTDSPLDAAPSPAPADEAAEAKPKNSSLPKAKPAKQKKHPLTLAEFEAAQRRGGVLPVGKAPRARTACGCFGTMHDVLTNCLGCGRILCAAEGAGECFTCGTLVVDTEQQLAMLAAGLVGVPTPGGTAGQAAADGDAAGARASALAASLANAARLLDYDATSAQRTTVIDVKADFIRHDGAAALWLSEGEKQKAAQVAAAVARDMERAQGAAPRAGEAVAVDLDLRRGKVERAKAPVVSERERVKAAIAAGDGAEQENDEDMDDDELPFDDEADLLARYAWRDPDVRAGARAVVRSTIAPTASSVAPSSAPAAVPETSPAPKGKKAAGTGAYEHTGLAVRPVYIDPKAAAAKLKAREKANAKVAAAAAAPVAAGADAGTAAVAAGYYDPSVPFIPGADPQTGKRSRKRRPKAATTFSSGVSGAALEDDPGCG